MKDKYIGIQKRKRCLMEEKQLKTGIDMFLEMVNSQKEVRVSDAAKRLGVPEATIELWADVLYQDGMVEINYDGFGKMVIIAARKKTEPMESAEEAKPSKPAEAGHDRRVRKKALGFKAKKGLKLLRKYSRHRDREAGQNAGGSIVSRVLRALKAPFGSGNGKKAENTDLAELQKKINELKKMSK